MRGLVLSMKECVRKHIAHTRASVSEHRSARVEIICVVEKKLHDIVSGHSVHDEGPLDIRRVVPSRGVLLLPRIHSALNDDILAVPEYDVTQPASSSRSKNSSRTLPKH